MIHVIWWEGLAEFSLRFWSPSLPEPSGLNSLIVILMIMIINTNVYGDDTSNTNDNTNNDNNDNDNNNDNNNIVDLCLETDHVTACSISQRHDFTYRYQDLRQIPGIHYRGCSGRVVQWTGVVLYNELVHNIIQITTPCFHCTPLWWILKILELHVVVSIWCDLVSIT